MARPRKKRSVGGRPTLFKPEFVSQVHQLCLLGATDAQVADFFEVSVPTIDKWKQSKPEFLQALRGGKLQADAKVAQSLYRRALGYRHSAVKILTVANGGNQGSSVEKVPYVEHYPPDTAAAVFWLKNRQSEHWADRTQQEHTGKNGGPIEVKQQSWQFGDKTVTF